MKTQEELIEAFKNSLGPKNEFTFKSNADGIYEVTRGDGVTFSLGDRVHSKRGRSTHTIVEFKIKQKQWKREFYSGVDEIWVVYDNNGGHWLENILKGSVPKKGYLKYKYPLDNIKPLPKIGDPGAFNTTRKYDIHTGIDLYCEEGDTVYSLTYGEVVDIKPFTGEKADCPWWFDTDCIIIKNYDNGKHIVYGEVIAHENIQIGDFVECGTILGYVKRVLKNDKGTPTSMLHLEYYDEDFDLEPVIWKLNEEKPKSLLDPSVLLDDISSDKFKSLTINFENHEVANRFYKLLYDEFGINLNSSEGNIIYDRYYGGSSSLLCSKNNGKLIITENKEDDAE